MLEKLVLRNLNSANEEKARQAYETIYKEFYKLVYFVCAKYLSVSEDIEDVVIDTFVTLFNERENVTNIKYFLTTVGKNKAINLAKKNSKVEILDDTFFENISNSSPVYSDLMNKVYKCLSKKEADIVIEHVVEGVPLKEIAQREKQSPNTIKSIYRRSINKLSDYLGGSYE